MTRGAVPDAEAPRSSSPTPTCRLGGPHRAHAVVEDHVRELKSTGLSNLLVSALAANQAWLEAALCAHDLTVWTQRLLFDGEHAVCERKRLRYRSHGRAPSSQQ